MQLHVRSNIWPFFNQVAVPTALPAAAAAAAATAVAASDGRDQLAQGKGCDWVFIPVRAAAGMLSKGTLNMSLSD